MLATDGTWRQAAGAHNEWRPTIDFALAASLVLALVVGAFLLARRSSGAIDAPLAPLPLAMTAIALATWASVIRLRLRDRRLDWLAATVLAFVAVACSFPGHRAIDWLVWLATFAALGLVPARRNSPATEGHATATQVIQQLTRLRSADGVETIRGTLVAEFLAGEQIAVLHIAFCPPFERLPTVDAEADDCDVKVAQVLHQGARLELRLPRAGRRRCRITVEFVATADSPLAV